VYAVVACVAILENIFPPTPSDVVIALAAFLSHRGKTSPGTVFLVTWFANVGGAGVVYLFARRYGKRFFSSRLGRSLMTPEAVVTVEREYLRFGIVGLFIARLLPGFRSFTAPFAGLVRLGAVRAFLPIALASAVWYGGIIFFAARLGRDWENVSHFISGLNRTIGAVALVALASGAAWLLLRRRRSARRQLQAEVTGALDVYPAMSQRALEDPAVAAVAALLLETERADRALSTEELATLERHLRDRLGLTPVAGVEPPVDAAALIALLEPSARIGVAERVRDLVFGEGGLQRHEAHVMGRVGRLLGLPDGELPARRDGAAP